MYRIHGIARHYDWGSPDAIPRLLGEEPTGTPVAELWFGAHPSAPARVQGAGVALDLRALLAEDPDGCLGEGVVRRFGRELPYLLKVIAPARPLSLQVHPDLQRARARFAAENDAGIPLDSPRRNYRDANHKPELVYALTRFEALCGFRAPRRAAELLQGLGTTLTDTLHRQLLAEPDAGGVRRAFTSLLNLVSRPSPEVVAEVVAACAARLQSGTPSVRADNTVVLLHREHPGDPGVVASLLLNPVTLNPGEALFVPAGGVHAYLSGMAVEVMASSDNVLRAGLTSKHIDVPEMLACVDYVAAPPIRLAPEHLGGPENVFYAPVDDFELWVADVGPSVGPLPLRGRGPRIILCVRGAVTVALKDATAQLTPGGALFLRADEGRPTISGEGTVVQADVP